MITIPDIMRRPAEVERDELRKQLASIREILKWECKLCTDRTKCESCVTKGLKDLAVTQSNTRR